MKLKTWIAVLIFLTMVNLAATGTFLYFHLTDRDREGPGFSRRPPSENFHLDREKRRQLGDLFRKHRDETREEMEKIQELEEELFELLQQDPVPMKQVEAKIEEIAQLRVIVVRKMVDAMVEAKSLLTPEEQRHFFDAMVRARPGKFGKHRPGFRRGGPRPSMVEPEFR